MKIENKKKFIGNKFNIWNQNSYIYKKINAFKNESKLPRSNSVGILINNNLNFGKNNNMFYKKNNNIGSNIINYNSSKNKNYNHNSFNI